MARRYYDRYEEFKENGSMKILPFLKIPQKSTDISVLYDQYSRLDIISQDYYNNPNMGWLIMQANSEFGSMEFDIPVGSVLRVPYPLDQSLVDYEKAIIRYKKIHGL
jgi:hypothetical protein